MLGAYDDLAPLRIIGIDPGTDTLGVSVLDVCLATNRILLQQSSTFSGNQMARNYRWLSDVHGDKVARLKAHEDNLTDLFHQLRPHEIISEMPYMGKFPAAFAALVECMNAIRNAVIRYDERMPLVTVDPPTVKNTLGVNGKSGDKTLMQRGILQLVASGRIENPTGMDVTLLDEHSIDSIAVAYVRANYVTANSHFS